MVVIQKNNGDEYPYLAICGQQGYVAQKIQNKLTDYPHGQTVGQRLLIIRPPTGNEGLYPERVRHFKLGKDYTHQRLMELQEA